MIKYEYHDSGGEFMATIRPSSDLRNRYNEISEFCNKYNEPVFITKNLCAEMSFGVAGLKFRSEKQRDEMGVEGKRRTSGADFKINILNINIGLTLCL